MKSSYLNLNTCSSLWQSSKVLTKPWFESSPLDCWPHVSPTFSIPRDSGFEELGKCSIRILLSEPEKPKLAWPNNPVADGPCTHRWVSFLAMTMLTNDRRSSTWPPANPIGNCHVERLKTVICDVPGIARERICSLPQTMAEAWREGRNCSASLLWDSVHVLLHKRLPLGKALISMLPPSLGLSWWWESEDRVTAQREIQCHSEIQQEGVTRFPPSPEPCLPGLPCQIRDMEGGLWAQSFISVLLGW